MPPAEVEPPIPVSEWPQTHALDPASTVISTHLNVFPVFPYTHYDYILSFIVIRSTQLAVRCAISMTTPTQICELKNMSVEYFYSKANQMHHRLKFILLG